MEVTKAAIEVDRSPGDVQWWKVAGKAVRYQLVDRLGGAQPSKPVFAQTLHLGAGIAGDFRLSVARQDDLSSVGCGQETGPAVHRRSKQVAATFLNLAGIDRHTDPEFERGPVASDDRLLRGNGRQSRLRWLGKGSDEPGARGP